MTLTFVRVLADAWALFRRERDLLLRVAGPFLFLPALALHLLLPAVPPLPASLGDEAAVRVWLDAFSAWASANAPWYLLAELAAIVGSGVITALLVDRTRPDVGAALRLVGRLLPRLVLASILVAIPVGLGLWLLILPGLYVQARLLAVVPVLVVERPVGAARSLARSLRLTRRTQLALFGTTTALLILQWLAMLPLAPLANLLGAPGRGNPVALAIVAAALALVAAGYRLAGVLAAVVAWRRLSSGT